MQYLTQCGGERNTTDFVFLRPDQERLAGQPSRSATISAYLADAVSLQHFVEASFLLARRVGSAAPRPPDSAHEQHSVGEWCKSIKLNLHAKQLRLPCAQKFPHLQSDQPIASSNQQSNNVDPVTVVCMVLNHLPADVDLHVRRSAASLLEKPPRCVTSGTAEQQHDSVGQGIELCICSPRNCALDSRWLLRVSCIP
jgi:hypothetical protein